MNCDADRDSNTDAEGNRDARSRVTRHAPSRVQRVVKFASKAFQPIPQRISGVYRCIKLLALAQERQQLLYVVGGGVALEGFIARHAGLLWARPGDCLLGVSGAPQRRLPELDAVAVEIADPRKAAVLGIVAAFVEPNALGFERFE